MMIFGVDAHKRTHTIVAVDENGKKLGTKVVGTTSAAHLDGLRWATEQSEKRVWAIEDCRHLSRRLEKRISLRRGNTSSESHPS